MIQIIEIRELMSSFSILYLQVNTSTTSNRNMTPINITM